MPLQKCYFWGYPPPKAGSVAPLFRAQIAAGDPITLTHNEVTRYFMTIPEAAQLVIQSSAMTVGGDVFALDILCQYFGCSIQDLLEPEQPKVELS
ncbi:hypothetical protein M2128_002013 [Polynucleobacter sphagniphilus]|nr:hypothetical protein [Polynucleobacter sphagniphilus]